MTADRLYLDYNATTPLLDVAREALLEALDVFGNPSSVHREGRRAKALLQEARGTVAELVGGAAENVVFTSGASESAATLLTPNYQLGRTPLTLSHLYIGATEHPCILAGGRFPLQRISIIPVSANGLIEIDTLRAMLAAHDQTQGLPLVALQYANHETGIIQPLADIAPLVREAGGVLIVDAVQAAGKERLNITENCGDFVIITAHKIGGPKGIGAFVASGSLLMPAPLISGGGQERGFRAGTQAVALVAAFGAAARYAHQHQSEKERLLPLRQRLEAGIKTIVSQAVIYGENMPRLANTCLFSHPTVKAETMQIAFDLAGIAVSSGSACSSGKVGTSAVLHAMGVGHNGGAIRVSMGVGTRESDIDRFLQTLQKIISRKK